MTDRGTRTVILALVIAIAVLFVVFAIGAFYVIARDDSNKVIDHWSHSGGQSSPVYVTKSAEAGSVESLPGRCAGYVESVADGLPRRSVAPGSFDRMDRPHGQQAGGLKELVEAFHRVVIPTDVRQPECQGTPRHGDTRSRMVRPARSASGSRRDRTSAAVSLGRSTRIGSPSLLPPTSSIPYVSSQPYSRPKEYVVDHKTHRLGQGTAKRPSATERTLFAENITNIWCARTWSEVDAWGLPGFGKLFWGDVVIRLCWGYDSHGQRVNRFFDWRETYTCGTKPMTLWTCDSTPDPDQVVKGAGTSTAPGHAGWRYRYRRAYWRFHYAYSGFPVAAKPFASITVRADGSYVWDKGPN